MDFSSISIPLPVALSPVGDEFLMTVLSISILEFNEYMPAVEAPSIEHEFITAFGLLLIKRPIPLPFNDDLFPRIIEDLTYRVEFET